MFDLLNLMFLDAQLYDPTFKQFLKDSHINITMYGRASLRFASFSSAFSVSAPKCTTIYFIDKLKVIAAINISEVWCQLATFLSVLSSPT